MNHLVCGACGRDGLDWRDDCELVGQDGAWNWGYTIVVLNAHMMRNGVSRVGICRSHDWDVMHAGTKMHRLVTLMFVVMSPNLAPPPRRTALIKVNLVSGFSYCERPDEPLAGIRRCDFVYAIALLLYT